MQGTMIQLWWNTVFDFYCVSSRRSRDRKLQKTKYLVPVAIFHLFVFDNKWIKHLLSVITYGSKLPYGWLFSLIPYVPRDYCLCYHFPAEDINCVNFTQSSNFVLLCKEIVVF